MTTMQERYHAEWVDWLYDRFADLNRDHFGGQLQTPTILIDYLTVSRRAQADAGPGPAGATGPVVITIHPALVGPAVPAPLPGGTPTLLGRFVYETLAHEAVHVWQSEVLGWQWRALFDWHGAEFRDKLAELGLELDPLDGNHLRWR